MRSASAALSTALSHGSSRSRWGISTAGSEWTVPSLEVLAAPQISSSSVVLPQPLGPTSAEQLAAASLQRDARERLHSGAATAR